VNARILTPSPYNNARAVVPIVIVQRPVNEDIGKNKIIEVNANNSNSWKNITCRMRKKFIVQLLQDVVVLLQEVEEGAVMLPHPALAKLRTKLGLTRPLHDYQALMDGYTTTTTSTTRSTHNKGSSSSNNGGQKKPIIPSEYVIARNDGTVWIGSTPKPMGPFTRI